MSSPSLLLTRLPKGYDGETQRMEVLAHDPDIHDGPGVYLQKVEGCGYTVFELTPEEATILGTFLIEQAEESVTAFRSKR